MIKPEEEEEKFLKGETDVKEKPMSRKYTSIITNTVLALGLTVATEPTFARGGFEHVIGTVEKAFR
jgi:hypothetical protein